MDERDNEFPDFPEGFSLTSDGSEDGDFFLTSDNDEKPLTSHRDEPSELSDSRRPMFERITPAPPRPDLHSRPPIRRPSDRLDPTLLNRRPRSNDPRVTDRLRQSDPRLGDRRPSPAHFSPDKRTPKPRKRAVRRKRFAVLYILMLVMGIAACLIFIVMRIPGIQGNIRERTEQAAPTPTPTPEIVIPPDIRNILAQIIRVDAGRTPSPILEVINLATGLRHEYNFTESTDMTNIHGRPMVFEELSVGQLLDIGFDANTNNMLSAHQSRRTWERRLQTNLRIDLENDTITIGNDVFTFSHHQTMVLYRGQPFPIANIQPTNSVTIEGYGNHVWLIVLDAGHGFLQFANTEHIIRGTIEVGHHFENLFEIRPLQLQEGTYRVVISGDNIETFVQHVEIVQGETHTLNLNAVQLRTGHLHITTTPSDAFVYINGERHAGPGPARLEYGEHIIRVEAYGYIPQEQIVNVTGALGHIEFELVEAVRTGTLRIITLPTNAQIFIGGVFAGYSELFHELTLGPATVTARLPGYEDTTISVEIVQGENDYTILLMPIEITPWPPATPLPPYEGNPFPTPTPEPNPTLPPIATPPPLTGSG
ncbi:MAG: PEGA domain-containing protein [Defluviitaleaceae bacterium]|nr:PEGA domain-containing protein [Defluviitaleaceae bacterium]